MFNLDRSNVGDGTGFGVQCSGYAGAHCTEVMFLYFIMGSCQGMKKCSMSAGVQCTEVFNLAGSTVDHF